MGHKKPVRIDPLAMALPKGGADSHAHLDGEEFDKDRIEVLERAFKTGISNIANVFLGPDDYKKNVDFFAQYSQVFYILGIHPCHGQMCTEECLDEMEIIFNKDKRVLAVGEIGLDYHWDDCPKDLQLQVFARQLELAKKLDKPVVLHCRDAETDCLAFLEAGGFKNYPLLWHCFGGNDELAKRIINNGWHISIPGAVTYPANKSLREAVKSIPADRLLLETDCPYLAPVPWRGLRNEPACLVFTANEVAKAREENAEDLWQTCGNNMRAFFGIE